MNISVHPKRLVLAAGLMIAVFGMLAALLHWGQQGGDTGGRPNVLLILIDDMGYNDLAINNGNPDIHTPNLDQLAREGVLFTRHYSASVCSPARAALLTGQYPARHGFFPVGRGISPQASTLPRSLSRAGYNTWHLGKWHVGEELPRAWPDGVGFQHWFGFLNRRQLEAGQRPSQATYEDPWLVLDGAPARQYSGHLNDILTEKALDLVAELGAQEAPWFINLWLFAPHSPSMPHPRFARLYPDDRAGRYRALVHQLDHNIGRILEALKGAGQYDNTLVIAVSDNGGSNRAIPNNLPFAGSKSTLEEGGVRTPLIVKWPRGGPAGQKQSQPVAILDLYPTVLAAAGIPPVKGLDGRDLALPDAPGRALFWAFASRGSEGYAVLSADGRWRLNRRWPWVDETVLVDLQANPGGDVRQAVDNPAVEQALYGAYLNWHRDVHQLDLQLDKAGPGPWTLSGDDFQRTPGHGGFTFALAFSDDFSGELVRQAGTWNAHRDAGGRITADFQGLQISANPSSERSCHSLVISGDFSRGDIWGTRPPSTEVRLYLDGQQAGVVTSGETLNQEHTAEPTLLGHTAAPRHSWGEPLVLNIALEASPVWDAAGLDRELCAALNAQL